jgi:hypothetical protein
MTSLPSIPESMDADYALWVGPGALQINKGTTGNGYMV